MEKTNKVKNLSSWKGQQNWQTKTDKTIEWSIKGSKTQMTKIRNESRNTAANPTEINNYKKILWTTLCQQLRWNSLVRHKWPKWTKKGKKIWTDP